MSVVKLLLGLLLHKELETMPTRTRRVTQSYRLHTT